VSRSARQVQLRRFLRGCHVVAFSPEEAHDVGQLLDGSGTSDVVDAHLAHTASGMGATVLTSDEGDLRRLSDHLSIPVPVRRA
jgi:predicted nucleic acid-binding protein